MELPDNRPEGHPDGLMAPASRARRACDAGPRFFFPAALAAVPCRSS